MLHCTHGGQPVTRPGHRTLARGRPCPHASCMALFFRVVDLADGRWACRQGRYEHDTHDDQCDAVAHIRQLAAAEVEETEIFLHHRDGAVDRLAAADPDANVAS